MNKLWYIIVLFIGFSSCKESEIHHENLGFELGDSLSIRGLFPLDDDRAWIASSHGLVAFVNAKEGFVHRFEVSDYPVEFRGIHAFNEKVAIAMASGFPARIFRTEDGGQHWKVVYEKLDSTYFLDAIQFNDSVGYCVGDPVDGRFIMLKSIDYGKSWKSFSSPFALPGEACFAASNGNLECKNGLMFVSGGSVSRLHSFDSEVNEWNARVIDSSNQSLSSGIFAFHWGETPLFVGGDYVEEGLAIQNGWKLENKKVIPMVGLLGYRSSVHRNGNFAISTGPNGTEYSNDAGRTWKVLFDEGFHTVRITQKAIWFAGSQGRVLRLARS